MKLLQGELDAIAREWNSHHIRPTRNAAIPSGAPDELYFLPTVQRKPADFMTKIAAHVAVFGINRKKKLLVCN